MNADILKSLVECPVCYQVPRGKILACSNSHKICEACFNKIIAARKQCPQGNCPYDQPPRRYRELEAIVENANIDFSCSNAEDGCRVEMEKETLKKHEAECSFRKVPCPDTYCEQLILFSSIGDHISSYHLDLYELSSPRLEALINNTNMTDENNYWSLMW